MAQCEYDISNPPLRCHRPTYQGSLCILHLPKLGNTPEMEASFLAAMQAEMSVGNPRANIPLKGTEFSNTASRRLGDLLAHGGQNVESVDLNGSVFWGDVWIFEKTLTMAIRLDHAQFKGAVKIRSSTFERRTHIKGAAVAGELNVQMCHFNEPLHWDGSKFQDRVTIVDCHFDEAHFPVARLGGTFWCARTSARIVSFQYSQFSRDATLRELQADECNLEHAEVGEGARFTIRGGRDGGKWVLRSLRIGDKGSVVLDQVDLQRASFLRADVTKFIFSEVRWERAKGRRRLHDETTVERADMDALAANYRQLVLNHEAIRDFESAEEFHVGEMEMRRTASRYLLRMPGVRGVAAWLRERHPRVFRCGRAVSGWINGYGLYYLVSKYGSNYWRAASVLALLIVAFAVGALYAGFAPVGDKGAGVIEYNLLRDSEHAPVSLEQVGRDLGDAMVYVLESATFQRERHFAALDNWGRLLVVAGTLLLPAQAALVLFALRRRFKR